MKKKILFTGASGFIGLELLKKLVNLKAYKIYCTINQKKINQKKITCLNVDLLNHTKLRKIVKKINPDILIHFAAFVNPGENEKNKIKSKKINYHVTKNLSKIINNDCHVIFLSTDKVYKNSKSIFKENDIAQSYAEYARNKIKSEKLIEKIFLKHHIFRLPIVHKDGDSRSNSFIDKMILKIKMNEKVIVAKNIYRSFIYINDLVKCIIKSLNDKNYGIYNLGTKKISYFSRLKQVASKIKLPINKNLVGEKNLNIKPKVLVLNSNKAKKIFKIMFS